MPEQTVRSLTKSTRCEGAERRGEQPGRRQHLQHTTLFQYSKSSKPTRGVDPHEVVQQVVQRSTFMRVVHAYRRPLVVFVWLFV